jgi:arylamine N-acetyltransferase
MAYDEMLAMRLRNAIGAQSKLTEKRMMGGVCFMLNGNMVGGADRTKVGTQRLMFRVGRDNAAAAKLPGGKMVRMGERTMQGFYFVDAEACDDTLLARWVALALEHARSLPPKGTSRSGKAVPRSVRRK